MGGNAFPGFHTPRLSHEQYFELRDKFLSILRDTFYEDALCAPEGPSKPDHGDVDILVSQPKKCFTPDDLASAFGARQRTRHGVTTSFLVPLSPRTSLDVPTGPSLKSLDLTEDDGHAHLEGTIPTRESYAQIDVHVCRPGFLTWEVFMGSYGDTIQILGFLNRGLGLTMNDKGLHVRVPELEPRNRKASMVYLTTQPDAVMAFLGLDTAQWKAGFETNEDIFAWCAAGRYFGQPVKNDYTATNSNDRQRQRKRQMFSDFFRWAEDHPEAFQNSKTVLRSRVLDDAIVQFSAQEQYSQVMAMYDKTVQEQAMLEAIANVVQDTDKHIKEVIRAIKRWTIINDNGKPELLDEEKPDIAKNPDWMTELSETQKHDFLNWLRLNHTGLRRREVERSLLIKDQREAEKIQKLQSLSL